MKLRPMAATAALTLLTIPAFQLCPERPADARGIGAGSGTAFIGAQQPCFVSAWDAVTMTSDAVTRSNNNCSYYSIWQMSLPVDAPGTYTPTLYVYTPFFGNAEISPIYCMSASSNYNGLAIQWSGYQNTEAPEDFAPFQPGTVSVPPDGFLFAACYGLLSNTITTVTW